MTKTLPKTKDKAFGKEVYLLGRDNEGIKYWLEAPSWNCGWYWGFGYIETYSGNRKPSIAIDISSHQHASGEYKHDNYLYSNDDNIFTGKFLKVKTFNEKEGWYLRELFAQFYHWQKHAGIVGRGNANMTGDIILNKDEKEAERINKVVLPEIMGKIIKILEPIN